MSLTPDYRDTDFVHVFFLLHADHRDLHSFPTRRSSDLIFWNSFNTSLCICYCNRCNTCSVTNFLIKFCRYTHFQRTGRFQRSEEHTSELQSQFHLVCRLLLEKKKNVEVVHDAESKTEQK